MRFARFTVAVLLPNRSTNETPARFRAGVWIS
jgi:hypothetical protein